MHSSSLTLAPRTWKTVAVFLLLSALYFADVTLRASLKTFWFDELFTVYLCRLPNFQATWTAVLHGSDFNPPLFYLATRASQHFSGEGLIATRLPAMIGFWIFSSSLYIVASRRLGRLPGLIAALFPAFTLAYSYAYEARSSAAVLGWTGFMLIAWQRTREMETDRWWHIDRWLLALSLSFLGALLTHVYAVYLLIPFLLVEAVSLLKRRAVRLDVCAALLLPVIAVAPLYHRMIRNYNQVEHLRYPGFLSAGIFATHLQAVYGPALAFLLLFAAIWAARSRLASAHAVREGEDAGVFLASLSSVEIALALSLLSLSTFGAFSIVVTHGPFFSRYFLAETAGVALLLAQTASSGSRLRIPRAVVTVMLVFLGAHLLIAAYFHVRHRGVDQEEPSSHFAFSPVPGLPLLRNRSLFKHPDQEILVTGDATYFYLQYYAPPAMRNQLVFGAPNRHDVFLVSFQRLSAWTHAGLRTTTYQDFFAHHDDFLVYRTSSGLLNGSCHDCVQEFLAAGYTLRSVERDDDNLLEHFSR